MKPMLCFLMVLACCMWLPLHAQEQASPSPIIFIYDASGSMWGAMDGTTKMEIAADVLGKAVNALPDNQKLSLVAYGHRTKGDCEDVEFLVDVNSGTKAQVNQSVAILKPLGKTPLAYSALQVFNKLRDSKLKATIILITDGIESCGGNICDVIKAARAEGIDFKLHIIGFGLTDEDTDQLKCAAEAGNGNYYNATDAVDLSDQLNAATTITIDDPEGNVSVFAIKNGIPIDAWVKAYDVNGIIKPVAVRTYQDTAMMYLPPGKYNLDVVPLGGSDVDKIVVEGIESFEDRVIHQTIIFEGGKLGIITTNNGANWDCIVKLFDEAGYTAASVRTYTEPKEVEVNPGIYNVSIQALGELKGVNTKVLIPGVTINAASMEPIKFNFSSGNFEISTKLGSEDIDCIVNINAVSTGVNIAGSRTYNRGAKFILMPDTYIVKVTPLGKHKDIASQTFNIEIKAEEAIKKEIQF